MSQALKEKILKRMQELDIQPKRSLGQNFLVSENIVNKIIEAAEPDQFFQTIEIGPGLGALTDDLNQKAQNFYVIELDKTFAAFWRQLNVEVVEVDALKHNWEKIDWNKGEFLLVSNLPYQISARLVVELSLLDQSFSRMVLMFQKEVAQRISAAPGSGDYGLLSVVAQSFWKTWIVSEAGAIDFMPKPNVASRVLGFQRQVHLPTKADAIDYLNFLKISFANRRKKLLPKLKGYQDKSQLVKIFDELQISEDVRAEKLDSKTFIDLYLALKKEY